MTQARRAREQASPGCQVHRRPNSRVLSACHSLPRQQKSNLSSSLSQAELPVLCFAFMGTDLYTNSEWPETPNPAASAWDYWCVPAVLTSWFCFWFFFCKRRFWKWGRGSHSRTPQALPAVYPLFCSRRTLCLGSEPFLPLCSQL